MGLKSCKRKGNGVRCELTLRNEGKDTGFSIHRRYSYSFDEFGGKYTAKKVSIAGGDNQATLISKVPVEATMVFENISKKATIFTRFDIAVGNDKVKFRDIAIR